MDPDQVTGSGFEKIQRKYTFLGVKADPLILVPKWHFAVEGGSEF